MTECSYAVVNQLNIIADFFPEKHNVKVLSFYAPYYSEEQDQSFEVLLDSGKHFSDKENLKAPKVKSPKPGEEAEFDEIESKYLVRSGLLLMWSIRSPEKLFS